MAPHQFNARPHWSRKALMAFALLAAVLTALGILGGMWLIRNSGEITQFLGTGALGVAVWLVANFIAGAMKVSAGVFTVVSVAMRPTPRFPKWMIRNS